MRSAIPAALALGQVALAFDLPDNLKALYEKHKSGGCDNELAGPFSEGASYCGDIEGAIFLKGDGEYDNMDIDCDGANNTEGDCENDPSGQNQTAFKDEVQEYGIDDLDANLHSYVVFGNEGTFEPDEEGMESLGIMAIVCNDQLFYGVWGDTNGHDQTGEASIALAKLCFPDEGLNGDSGHDDNDVLYIGFKRSDSKPGADGAKWDAESPEEFQESLREIGDQLVAGL